MQSHEASGPDALAGLPSTLSKVIGSPTTSPLDLIASTIPTTLQSPTALSQQQIQDNVQHVLSSLSSDYENGRTFAASGNSSGSTGKGILIGILSAFGSAAIAFIVLAIFFFFKYTRRGRIMLDSIGRPGEYDDEQAFAREEEAALEGMDDLSRSEYLRAKGMAKNFCVTQARPSYKPRWLTTILLLCSLRSSQSSRIYADRYLSLPIPRNPRKRRLRLGIPARTRDRQLFCGGAH